MRTNTWIPDGSRGAVQPTFSIVAPAYNEEGNIVPLYHALCAVLDPLDEHWELVIADDGSSDATWDRVRALRDRDTRVRGVRLSRNFGHQYALLAGLAHARGSAVISMDADLQHPPELLPAMIGEWRRGNLIVHTVRQNGDDLPLLKRITSRVFYRLYSALSGSRIDPGTSDFRLLDRRVLDELLRFGENGVFLRGLVQWVGYPAVRLPFVCGRRHSGTTKYTLMRMIKFAWTAVTSFSLTPLRAGVVLGMLTSMIAFGGIVYAVGSYLAGHAVAGWASVLSIVSFQFGVLFILLGIIGEYVGKILLEVKRRPRYLVQELIDQNDTEVHPLLAAEAPIGGRLAPLTVPPGVPYVPPLTPPTDQLLNRDIA